MVILDLLVFCFGVALFVASVALAIYAIVSVPSGWIILGVLAVFVAAFLILLNRNAPNAK